ncbi:MAG: hypothetical protein RBT75_19210 [Anaerolineae bacterium]|jgi:hypothetical protein|nr:hypothetical protein [Anaerolineae bacterium]
MMTIAEIPATLRPYFQEYAFEDLDPDRDAFLVIERTLAWGEAQELRWLFARYGAQRLAAWVQQVGWRCLPQRRFKYWRAFFDLRDMSTGGRIWAH